MKYHFRFRCCWWWPFHSLRSFPRPLKPNHLLPPPPLSVPNFLFSISVIPAQLSAFLCMFENLNEILLSTTPEKAVNFFHQSKPGKERQVAWGLLLFIWGAICGWFPLANWLISFLPSICPFLVRSPLNAGESREMENEKGRGRIGDIFQNQRSKGEWKGSMGHDMTVTAKH
jgi:hypothetical protein